MEKSRFMRIIGKKSTGIVITILTFVIVFGAVFSISNLSIAADSLPGIVDIRNDMASTDTPYSILEIVPDREAAEFGFLVGGEEPLNASVLYDAATQDWLTWQEYLTMHTEDMTPEQRETFMNDLVTANADYISVGSASADKPMWYQTYTEQGVTAETEGAQVLYGGNTPVYGWLVSDDTAGIGWNAKFSQITFSDTYENLVASSTPYYIVDASRADAITPLDEDTLRNGVYPDSYYVYKLDAKGTGYLPAGTIGEMKALCEADNSFYGQLSNYFIVKFKVLTSSDYTATAGPLVYEASAFTYVDADAPYIIEPQASGTKGHNLVKPSDNVYYTGGLYSNEWFKQYVLDLDATEIANYNVEVVTLTAGEIGAMTRDDLVSYLAKIDYIYLNPGNATYQYDAYINNSNLDLDDEAVELIFEKICNEKTPCIVDYSLKSQGDTDSDITNSRVYALTCMLMQADYRSLLVSGEFDVSQIAIGSGSVGSWSSSIKTTNNYSYVNGNVMVINSATGERLTNNFHTTPYDSTVVAEAYAGVLAEIELENLYRAADQTAGYEQLSTDIYKSTVLRFSMNYVSARQIETKTAVNVLEIQPGNTRYPDNSTSTGSYNELTPNTIRTWMGVDSSVSVNIKTMTSIEFIGKIEDLNSEYDMIYIGADIYGLRKSGSTTVFADPDIPNGMIYTNIGDLKNVRPQLAGHLATDYYTAKYNGYYRKYVKSSVQARYNGNDITADKYNALVDYMNGTYPIIVADALCQNNTTPSSAKVDNCSYLYSFLEQHLDEANVFKVSEIKNGDNTNFKFYANRGKLSIGTAVLASEESSVTNGTAFVVPGVIDETNDTTEGHVTYISRENGKFYLKYKFTITNNGAVYDTTKYTAALYLDSNSDGKFSAEYEEIPDITLTHVASGRTITNGQLVAGEQYILTRQVPETYSGILTWKVEVKQTSNQYIRDSIKGYTRLNDPDRGAETIEVLQLYRDRGTSLVLEYAIGNTKTYDGYNDVLETLVWGGTYGGVTYEGITDDFKFHFTSLTHSQFNDAYESGKLNGKTFNLMDYDMLVLGFYDSYSLTNNSIYSEDISGESINGTNGIKEFIDSGKSVLFAHDTTSVTIVEDYQSVLVQGTNQWIYTGSNSANVWAYYLNKNIRDMVGLDTYGISLETKDGVSYAPLSTGYALETSAEGKALLSKLENKLDSDGHYQIGLKAIAYKPNSRTVNSDGTYSKQTVPQTQGFAYSWMDYNWGSDYTTYRSTKSTYNTWEADRVNEGQITTYPYYLDEHIDIARTHSQYFTLDLNTDDDGDNETDLVVWYTMAGTFNTASTRDVMNNYYIYNKGNITYTGFGDFDTQTYLDLATEVEECKLFVNTLVAAYNASVKEPDITVYESEENLSPTSTFYEYGDVDNEVAFRENTQRMYFSVNDTNVIRGTKSATAEYYVALRSGVVADSATTYTTGGVTYYLYTDSSGVKYIKLNDLKTYTTTGAEVSANALQCGVVYYVDIPTTVFDIPGVDGQNVNTFMVAAKTKLQKTGSITGKITTVETSTTYSKVEFIHVELFSLD